MGAIDLSRYLWPDAEAGRQPQHVLRIDPYNPLARGLILAPLGHLVDAVSGRRPTRSAAAGITPFGTGLALGGSDYAAWGLPVGSGDFTILCLVNPSNVNNRCLAGVFQGSSGSAAIGHYLSIEANARYSAISTSGDNWAVASGAYATAGRPARVMGVFRPAYRSIYVDSVGSKVTSSDSRSPSGLDTMTAGAYCYGANRASYFIGGLIPPLIWARALSDAEVEECLDNPWRVFAQRRPFVFFPSTDGSTTLAAAGSDTAGGSATVAAQVALAGIGVSQAGGTAGASVAIPLAAAGISQASGAAGATATITIGAAGLAAAAATAGIDVAAALAAAGASQAAGTANISATGNGQLAASGGDTASGSAVLAITITLVATGSSQAAGTANLNASGGNPIAGSGGATAGGSGTLQATVTLTAAGLAQALATGQLAVQVPLAGFAAAQAAGTANLVDANAIALIKDSRWAIGSDRLMAVGAARTFRVTRSRHAH